MRVLLTNDDGYKAPGILALYNVLKRRTEIDLVLIAPTRNRTAASRAVTVGRAFAVRRVPYHDVESIVAQDVKGPHDFWAVDGKPVDCVTVAKNHLYKNSIDLVISGINRGPNMGRDVIHSGTLGAAHYACNSGIPAIGISTGSHDPTLDHWGYLHGAQLIDELITQQLHKEIPSGVYLSINIPNISKPRGIRITKNAHYLNYDEICRPATKKEIDSMAADGKPIDPHATYVVNTSQQKKVTHVAGTDLEAVSQGYVSITPFDTTPQPQLRKLNSASKFTSIKLI